jgi:photosystem II stability/assembly factor-like uncharacterized protein
MLIPMAVAWEVGWTSNGPFGGAVYSIVVDPTTPAILYAGTDDAVFKSIDGGRTWARASTGLPASRYASLAVAADGSGTLYAGTTADLPPPGPNLRQRYGVFKSSDGGQSWNPSNNFLFDSGHFIPDVIALGINPRNPADVLAGLSTGGIFRSIDGGTSWRSTNGAGVDGTGLSGIVFHPSDPLKVFAVGTGLFTSYESSDGGGTWAAFRPNGTISSAIAFDPLNALTVYSGSARGAGVLKSTDGGRNWIRANRGLPEDPPGAVLPVLSLAVSPAPSRELYAAVWGAGIFKTVDGGTSWKSVGGSLLTPFVSQVAAAGPSTLFCNPHGAGVWVTRDDAGTWSAVNDGLSESAVTRIATDPTDSLLLYAASDGGGISKSTDGGNRWSPANSGLPEGHINGVVLSPSDSRVVFAYSLLKGVFKSVNGAASWHPANDGLDLVVGTPLGPSILVATAFAVSPSDPSIVYLGTTRNFLPAAVFRSADGGNSWEATGFPGETVSVGWLAVDPGDSAVVYVIGHSGYTYRTRDGGRTWTSLGNPCVGARTITIDRADPSTLYAGGIGTICRSRNRGDDWLQIGSLYDPLRPVNQILIDPNNPTTLYAATGDYNMGFAGGVSWSRDAGATWKSLGELPIPTVTSLALDRTGRIMFAGTYGGGVYSLDLDSLRQIVVTVPARPKPRLIHERRQIKQDVISLRRGVAANLPPWRLRSTELPK